MNQTQCTKANTRSITRKVWRYLQADFDRASEIIDTIDWEAELNSDDIDHSVTAWNTSFIQIMELCIPHATIKVKRKVPWINKKIVREISKRNALFHRARLSKQSTAMIKKYLLTAMRSRGWYMGCPTALQLSLCYDLQQVLS